MPLGSYIEEMKEQGTSRFNLLSSQAANLDRFQILVPVMSPIKREKRNVDGNYTML